jgi:type IV secretion system protein TrbC
MMEMTTHEGNPDRRRNAMNRIRALSLSAAGPLSLLLFPQSAHAGSFAGGMPWETPLQRIQASITGPTAKALVLIAICLCGVGMMFSEGGGFLRKLFVVALGATFAIGGGQWILTFFGFGGGLSL